MIRRITVGLGALAAISIATLAVPGVAHAATGALIINGRAYIDPASGGCYEGQMWPLIVNNETDGTAVIFAGPDCTGEFLRILTPGQTAVSELGQSVAVS